MMYTGRADIKKRYKNISTSAGSKGLETSIIECNLKSDDSLQSKTLFLVDFELRSSTVRSFSIAYYVVWVATN